MLGAAMGIVIDNTEEDIENLVMTDDGSGAGIRIPSMLISKKDGIKLLDYLATASEDELSQIAMIAEFDISRPDNRVEYDFWFTQTDDKAMEFMSDFARVDKMFGEQVLMTPRHVVWSCIETECDEEFKKKNCFADGKYCAINSNHPSISGTTIMREDLRAQYVYEKFYNQDDISQREKYWKYMQEVEKRCYGQTHSYDCIQNIFTRQKLDFTESQNYIFDKFYIPDRDPPGRFNYSKLQQPRVSSDFFDNEIEYYQKYGSKLYPAIVINNQTFRG